jgi:NADP-dependent 3-hydroxy acid dehydrogenase YdfG
MNRIVVVTGASGGIGAAVARQLARQDDALVLLARRPAELEAVALECGPNALAITGDATRRGDLQRAVRESLARFGRIDVWINNVGQGITRMPSELTDEDIDAMMRINVKTALYGMQEVLPHFKERGTGHVINISSMLGRIPYATFRSAYCGAKHFLNALTSMMREEVQQTHPGIQFSLVSPPAVRTEFGTHALHGGPDSRSLPNTQSAEAIAEVIARVIETRAPEAYTVPGARDRVIRYYSSLGAPESPETA